MHAAVLTLILMAGTSGDPTGGRATSQTGTANGQCANCEADQEDHGCKLFGGGKDGVARAMGDMPQSCYNPAYGCYPGNDRRINRYPAFYGTYYRKPYNYRNVFDYPWHAGLHEPTSLFSYNVVNPEEQDRNTAPTPRGGLSEKPRAVEHHTN